MNKRITVVEDDPDILFTVKTVLENVGYKVTALSTGKSIMGGYSGFPDLYVLDKRMPDMDGLDICRYIRNKPDSEHIPIIIISASPKMSAEALRAGANGFLAKPFDIQELVAIVSRHLNESAGKEAP